MTESVLYVVSPEEGGERLDVFVAGHNAELSRSRAQSLISEGAIQVNGRQAKPSQRLASGDHVSGIVTPAAGMSAVPEAIPLNLVYRDEDLVVVDKPAGLVVHPAPGHTTGTLANALAFLFPQTMGVGGEERPGIVHRLDKDTSGLIVVALTPSAHRCLQDQLASRTAGREYTALVQGHPVPDRGVIDAPIGRDPDDRTRMAVHGIAARTARTMYRVEENVGPYSLVHARLQSGRTHQIRVHFAALGHPIVGDWTYGGPSLPGLQRQFLHAATLSLRSPSSGEILVFHSPLPSDLTATLENLHQLWPAN